MRANKVMASDLDTRLEHVPYPTLCRRLDFARLGLRSARTSDDTKNAMLEIEKCKAELVRRGYQVPPA
jgi:hypothetical protein